MKYYEVIKNSYSTDVAEITIDKGDLKHMSDSDILRVVNRMLVLNKAKVRVSKVESRDESYNMVTTDDEIVTFVNHGNNVYIKYHTYYYTFTLEEIKQNV